MNRILMALLIAVIAIVHNASCAGTSDSDVQQKLHLNVGQTQLQLEEHNGMCNAIASTEQGYTAQHALGIPWPCRFHTDKAGNIRTIQEAGYVYVLVESSSRTTNLSNDCETHLQAIRARGTSIEVSQHKDRVASCPPFQWDAVLFKELFN
jgi:hypothetical protein